MGEMMGQAVLIVAGLTAPERQDLLSHLKEDTISPDRTGLPSTALGDFGATALLFLASASLISGILAWVGKRPEDIAIKIDILKIVKFEITKTTSLEDIKKKTAEKGLTLDD
jgi:hypothetical protein